MDDIGAAVLLPQTIIGRSGVEKQYPIGFSRISSFKQVVSGEVGYDERNAPACELMYGRCRIVTGLQLYVDERITLIEKPAGRVIVLDRHLSAGESVVGCRHLHK